MHALFSLVPFKLLTDMDLLGLALPQQSVAEAEGEAVARKARRPVKQQQRQRMEKNENDQRQGLAPEVELSRGNPG